MTHARSCMGMDGYVWFTEATLKETKNPNTITLHPHFDYWASLWLLGYTQYTTII